MTCGASARCFEFREEIHESHRASRAQGRRPRAHHRVLPEGVRLQGDEHRESARPHLAPPLRRGARRRAHPIRCRHRIGGIAGRRRGAVHPPLRRRGWQRRRRDQGGEIVRLRNHQRCRRHPGEVPRPGRDRVRTGAEGQIQETCCCEETCGEETCCAEESQVEAMKARNADLWSGLALAVLGAYIIVQALGWDYMGPDGPGAGFFPLWYGIAMLLLSAALVVSSMLHTRPEALDWRGAGRGAAVAAALAIAVALFKVAGFAIGFAALAFFIVSVMYRRPGRGAAAVAVGRAGGFYLLFPVLLGVNLP